MPLMVTKEGMSIPESDTICRYLMEKYPQVYIYVYIRIFMNMFVYVHTYAYIYIYICVYLKATLYADI
jgi:hypothetical protein